MTSLLEGKSILLGVCGGIAAYKSVELLRLLRKADAGVRVIMTKNATHFIGPMTYEALSGVPVCCDLFAERQDAAIKHIEWAQSADAVIIAPATANMIGKLANGIADDALSTIVLAATCPVMIAPSMNTHMYENRAVQRNLDVLEEDGLSVVEPGSGELACGTTGPGRLPEPEFILDRLTNRLSKKDFKNINILVTAGPTQEPMDPVRFISNPSTGKMGFAIARAAEYRGANVTLITGPSHLSPPAGVHVIRVQTAAEMAKVVVERMYDARIIIKTAAVSDYRPSSMAANKIKKDKDNLVLELEKTQDILRSLGERKGDKILVGFAAETQHLEEYAQKKLSEKNLDLIVGNIVGKPGTGFGSDSNQVTFYFKDGGSESLPGIEKDAVAQTLLDRIKNLLPRG